MTASSLSHLVVPPQLQPLAAMALLLQKLDQQPRHASPAQYRQLALKLGELLVQAEPGPALDQLLSVLPAAAELYENQRYAQAGLCRAPLQQALDTELAAAAVIRRVRGADLDRPGDGPLNAGAPGSRPDR